MQNRLSQAEVNARCAEAMAQYLKLDSKMASLVFACQLQGFVAAEVERGVPFSDVIHQLGELIEILVRAQNN